MTVNWAALCPWCSHRLHVGDCGGEIHIGTAKQPQTAPCPCRRHHETGNPPQARR